MTCNKRDKNSAIRFFKIITATSLEAGKLKVPNGFTRKHGGDVSNSVFLKPPDDKKWKIHWTKDQDGYIWFEKGWKEFASYYSLDHGHLILFEYNKTVPSHFEVHIFDKSTLEIEYPFHGSKDEQNNFDQILDERQKCKKSRLKSPESCPQPRKKLRTCTSGNVGRSSKLPKMPQHVNGTEFENSTFADGNVGGGALECLKRNKLTCKNTKIPSFRSVIKPSYVSEYLHVRLDFAKKHLENNQSDIIILHDMDGKTWNVKYLHGRSRISSGWRKFVLDNNLKVGDVCDFVLTKSQPLSFKVSILQLGGDQPHSTPPQESRVNGLDPAAIIIDEERETTINRKALNQANEFASELENPYFIVQIKPSNRRDYRQEVCIDFVRNYFSRKQWLMLRFEKKPWRVKLNRYPNAGTAKLCKGWARFARKIKLVAGDVCVFELINKEDAHAVPELDVHVFKG
ncbi:B3 domain-containing transcription factor VRN1-like isoform X2 [Lotus japonicus]|uniref:B3 domain-containing transcription factor VRN1-like isoform X2 n=1 Tax=Lotus japonicus TaxID=34305 RepID=UPI00258BA9FB|nr:B3 domain-containing transcription factor VRN1-like isoform X2 [Lotus japonicus]